jgi:hypothetical protein
MSYLSVRTCVFGRTDIEKIRFFVKFLRIIFEMRGSLLLPLEDYFNSLQEVC